MVLKGTNLLFFCLILKKTEFLFFVVFFIVLLSLLKNGLSFFSLSLWSS